MIRYELPMSKVWQALKSGSSIGNAHAAVARFLAGCTTASVDTPISVWVTVNDSPERDTQHLRADASRLFGEPDMHFDGLYTQHRWTPHPDRVADAVAYIQTADLGVAAVRPYAEVRCDYLFAFTQPATGTVLPRQSRASRLAAQLDRLDAPSHLAVFLGRNCRSMPELFFPFDDLPSFEAYLASVADLLPFQKFDRSSLRWLLTGPSGEYARRLTTP